MLGLKWICARPKRSKKIMKMVVLIIITVLCFSLLLHRDTKNKKNAQNTIDKPNLRLELRPGPELSLKSPQKCEQNLTAFNITGFAMLPKRIQDFLVYRHCRYFPMLLNVPGKCGGPDNSADVFLLLVIKSSPPNYERREVLRKTWASERHQSGMWIRTVFISGTTGTSFEKERLNYLLEMENREHQDILQWDFEDTFLNLTLKQVLFLEWMERFCPNVHFLLNGDDDIFANTDNMVEYLKALGDNNGSKHLFIGSLMEYTGPIRESNSKYYVPAQIQESEIYPPYCSGGGFLVSRFTSRTIYNMSHSVPLIPIDDAYMGMCLEKAGLKPMGHIGIRPFGLDVPSSKLNKLDPCYYREILLVHRFHPTEIYIMWHEIHREDLVCGKNTFISRNNSLSE